MNERGVLAKRSITRVAVIGPGLDFTDKGFGYDFYPLQTLQPFAIYDSLVRLGLAEPGKIEVIAFDISQEVLEHLRARGTAPKRRELHRAIAARVLAMGGRSGSLLAFIRQRDRYAVAPIQPPPALSGLETRAVAIRPEVVLSCKPVDLNVVFEQFAGSATKPFDLIIATNVFLYYDTFEQALALRNISTLLKPGGFFLTNDWLPHVSQTSMRSTEYTPVRYGESADWGDNVFWWQRQ